MKLIFEKSGKRIVIDDKGKGINGILTTDRNKTDYPNIYLTKGGTTKYFQTKWQISVTNKIIYDNNIDNNLVRLDGTLARTVPIHVDSNIVSKIINGTIKLTVYCKTLKKGDGSFAEISLPLRDSYPERSALENPFVWELDAKQVFRNGSSPNLRLHVVMFARGYKIEMLINRVVLSFTGTMNP